VTVPLIPPRKVWPKLGAGSAKSTAIPNSMAVNTLRDCRIFIAPVLQMMQVKLCFERPAKMKNKCRWAGAHERTKDYFFVGCLQGWKVGSCTSIGKDTKQSHQKSIRKFKINFKLERVKASEMPDFAISREK
jgi:hypothetical protein